MGAGLRALTLISVFVFGAMTGGCVQVWEKVQAVLPGTASESAPQSPGSPLVLEPLQNVEQAEIAALQDLANFETAAGTPTDRHPAATQVEKFGNDVLIVLGNDALSADQRIGHFRDLLARDLDIGLIGRFVLGRHWHSADEAQRAAYLAVFSDFLVQTYSTRLGGIQIDGFDVLETRAIGKNDILVRATVDHGTRKPVRADWRMRAKDGRFLILDLSVEGVSMALVLRQEFASVLRKRGLDGLMHMLRERTG